MSGSGASGNKFRMSVSYLFFFFGIKKKPLLFFLAVGLSVPCLFSGFDFVNMNGVDVGRDLRGSKALREGQQPSELFESSLKLLMLSL